jgi:hypothetical protein
MAATVQVIDRGAAGDLFTRIVDITLDASYPVGGYPVTPGQAGFGTNGSILFADLGYSKTGGWELAWDYTNGKLQVFDSSGAAGSAAVQLTGGQVLTGVVARVMFWGKGQG